MEQSRRCSSLGGVDMRRHVRRQGMIGRYRVGRWGRSNKLGLPAMVGRRGRCHVLLMVVVAGRRHVDGCGLARVRKERSRHGRGVEVVLSLMRLG